MDFKTEKNMKIEERIFFKFYLKFQIHKIKFCHISYFLLIKLSHLNFQFITEYS